MAPDDDFETFRSPYAELDVAAQRRIRERFEALRAAGADHEPTLDTTPAADDRHGHRSRRTLAVAVAAGVALVALAVGVLVAGRDDTSEVTSGIEEVPLAELQARAANRPDTVLAADEALYLEQRRGQRFPASSSFTSFLDLLTIERWNRPDGTGFERTATEYTPLDSGAVPDPIGPTERSFDEPDRFQTSVPYEQLRALPTTPDALVAWAREGSDNPEDDSVTAERLAGLLVLDVAPPAVRAAGFGALASLGARPLGTIALSDGRSGIAFGEDSTQPAGDSSHPSWMVVADPSTTAVLGFARDIGSLDDPFRSATQWTEYGPQRVETSLPG